MKIKLGSIRQAASFALLLFYPFNASISNGILFGIYNPFVFTALGILLLLPDLYRKMKKATFAIIFAELLVIAFVFLGNKLNGRFFLTSVQILYLLLIPVIMNCKIRPKILITILSVYMLEHIIGTLFPILMPSFYSKSFLPYICSLNETGRCFARNAFLSGKNAGLTNHYSTNGCYVALSALYYYALFSCNKQKKYGLLAALAVVCLLFIGKRAHLLFTIISIAIAFITREQHFSFSTFINKNIKLIIVGMVSMVIIVMSANFIPQIRTTFDRIIETKSMDDVSNGRGPLHRLATQEWARSPIIGNGWGYYTEKSHETFGVEEYGTDYIHAHNDFLELLCDVGIIGLIIYLVLLLKLMIRSYKERNNGSLQKFSFLYIMFMVMYSLSGTPLYLIPTYSFFILVIMEKIYEKNRRSDLL